MNDFTSLRDIGVGDVITVEPFFPHSLQHGVRVIEFQTASYERHILSFGQKVLTQDHWDTEVGVAEAILDIPEQKPLKQLPATQGCKIELVADFQAFTARRITISAGYRYTPEPINNYQILIGISGRAEMDCGWIEPEAAFFIPANMPKPLTLKSRDGAVLLIAEPH